MLFILSLNTRLDYVGIEAIDLAEGDITQGDFFQNDWELEEALGENWGELDTDELFDIMIQRWWNQYS